MYKRRVQITNEQWEFASDCRRHYWEFMLHIVLFRGLLSNIQTKKTTVFAIDT